MGHGRKGLTEQSRKKQKLFTDKPMYWIVGLSGQPSPPLPNHVVDVMKQMDSKQLATIILKK